VSVPVDARVGQPAADPSSLYKGEVAAAVLPTEQPKTVTLKVLGSGALKDRITSVITVCSAAFVSYQSAQPVAAFATTAGDLAGWSPGRAKVLASDFSAKRSSLEPVAMCYLDGMFGQKEPGGVRERALWVIGADGNPVLYSIGAVVDVGVANPSVKRATISYPADSKQPTGTLTTVPLNNADSVKGLTPPVTGPAANRSGS